MLSLLQRWGGAWARGPSNYTNQQNPEPGSQLSNPVSVSQLPDTKAEPLHRSIRSKILLSNSSCSVIPPTQPPPGRRQEALSSTDLCTVRDKLQATPQTPSSSSLLRKTPSQHCTYHPLNNPPGNLDQGAKSPPPPRPPHNPVCTKPSSGKALHLYRDAKGHEFPKDQLGAGG